MTIMNTFGYSQEEYVKFKKYANRALYTFAFGDFLLYCHNIRNTGQIFLAMSGK